MDQNSKVFLTLDNVSTISKFIKDRDAITKTELGLTIEDKISSVRQTINDAKSEIENDYNNKVAELNNQLNTISADNTAARAEIEAQKQLLEQNKTEQQEALDALNNSLEQQLTQLTNRVDGISSDLAQGGIFTNEQIGEIAKTAFIDSVKFTEDMIEAPTIMAKDIVSLVGHFGTIKAANIEGEEIAGHTIKSTSTIFDYNNPFNGQAAWALNNAGNGHLAKGNISWDENGVVTFSPNVALNWNSGINDALTKANEALDATETIENNIVELSQTIPSADNISAIIAEATIDGTKITDNSISSDKILANTITANNIAAGTITSEQIAANTITADNIAADFISTIKLDASQITSGQIAADKIAADGLVVKELNTRPGLGNNETGLAYDQVRIQNNEIIVSGRIGDGGVLYPKPVLSISGDNIKTDNIKEDISNTIYQQTNYSEAINSVSFTNRSNTTPVLEHSLKVYKLNTNNLNIGNTTESNKIRLFSADGERLSCTLTIADINLDADTGSGLEATTHLNAIISIGFRCIANGNPSAYSARKLHVSNGIFDESGKNWITIDIPFETSCAKLNANDADIYLVIKCDDVESKCSFTLNLESEEYINTDGYLSGFTFKAREIMTNLPNVSIHKDCFRYFVDDYNYFNFDSDGYLTYYFNDGVYGIGSDENGLWLKIGDYKVSVNELNDTLAVADKTAKELAQVQGEIVKIGSDYAMLETNLNVAAAAVTSLNNWKTNTADVKFINIENKQTELDDVINNGYIDDKGESIPSLRDRFEQNTTLVNDLNNWKTNTVEPQILSVTSNLNEVNKLTNIQSVQSLLATKTRSTNRGLNIRLLDGNQEVDRTKYLYYGNNGVVCASVLPTCMSILFHNSGLTLQSIKSCSIDAWNVTINYTDNNVLDISIKSGAGSTKLFGNADIILEVIDEADGLTKLTKLPIQIIPYQV